MPTVALALPEGRHYEMVSPPYKGGYEVSGLPDAISAVAPDGESVAYGSIGTFAGTPSNRTFTTYIARREAGKEWKTAPLATPATKWPEGYEGTLDFSSNLEWALSFGKPGPDGGWAELEGEENDFLLHLTALEDTPENWLVAGEPLIIPANISPNYKAGSADLSHLIVVPAPAYPLLSAANEIPTSIFAPPYDLVSRGGSEHVLSLIGLTNDPSEPKPIGPDCEVQIGTETGRASTLGALALDGREIFFTAGVSGTNRPECSSHDQLFVRLDDKRTLEVSRPFSPPCVGESAPHAGGEVPCEGATGRASAEFVGASEDGTKVFFTTEAPLLSTEDKDTQNDLYMATIGCPAAEPECAVSNREVTSLIQVSHDPNGGAAEVQGVLAVSPNGSHVYFVARGVLSEGANVQGDSPVEGADNLYAYDSVSGKIAFIADLCSGPGLSGGPVKSGGVEDVHCPITLEEESHTEENQTNDRTLWSTVITPETQTTPTGEFLIFSSYGQLVSNDTNNAKDVYRYDAETGMLERISNGNCSEASKETRCDATLAKRFGEPGSNDFVSELNSRVISDDGSRILFETAEALSPSASNGLVNAYEWHEGVVSLVSSGSDPQAVTEAVITPDGQNVFFTTSQGLLPQDTDGVADIYDARFGEGFPEAPTPPKQCAGDGCRGPLTNPAPLLVPGSLEQAAGENLKPTPAVTQKKKATARKKPKPKKKARKKSKRNAKAKRAARKGKGATR